MGRSRSVTANRRARQDGAHIAGELINYFTIMFPSLLRAKPDFLMRLGTPIIRLKPKGAAGEALSFFTTSAFRTWRAGCGLTDAELHRRYRMKYLKGLASSNEDDAHYYFGNLEHHLVPIVFGTDADDEIVDKWFRKNRADDRKAPGPAAPRALSAMRGTLRRDAGRKRRRVGVGVGVGVGVRREFAVF